MNLFIDTNILLSFYHLSSDDLEELKKLIVLIEKEEIKLVLPSQVVSEFWRNRENKIYDGLKKLHENKLNIQFPQFCRDYEEYNHLKNLLRDFKEKMNILNEKITTDLNNHELKADQIINKFFTIATVYDVNETIITKSKLRIEIGNPPGKNGSLGDAINWETLLENVPNEETLFIVTSDKDYYSPLKENSLQEFLLREWNKNKNSIITSYKKLSDFFNDNYPDIKLASELEKEILIRKLSTSPSFSSTHNIISKLAQYSEFSPIQINEIVGTYISNDQIYRIINDLDVKAFIENIIKNNKDKIDDDIFFELEKLLNSSDKSLSGTYDDELPF